MSFFPTAVERVLGHEGGYSNNPIDPGGETNWGITRRTAWANGYKGEMRFLTREQAIEIYEKGYWQACSCDLLPPPLSFQVFDAAVNSGPPQAIKWLQCALGVNDDGIIGPETLSAIKALEDGPLATELGIRFIVQRGLFQTSLPTWPAFGKGWTRRNYANLEYLLKDAKG